MRHAWEKSQYFNKIDEKKKEIESKEGRICQTDKAD